MRNHITNQLPVLPDLQSVDDHHDYHVYYSQSNGPGAKRLVDELNEKLSALELQP